MEKVPQLGTVPLLARSLAVSLPIPVLAPVMTTVFPSNLSSEDQWLQHTPLNKASKSMDYIFFLKVLKIWSLFGHKRVYKSAHALILTIQHQSYFTHTASVTEYITPVGFQNNCASRLNRFMLKALFSVFKISIKTLIKPRGATQITVQNLVTQWIIFKYLTLLVLLEPAT